MHICQHTHVARIRMSSQVKDLETWKGEAERMNSKRALNGSPKFRRISHKMLFEGEETGKFYQQ